MATATYNLLDTGELEMTNTATLYRVLREHGSNQGRYECHGQTVLYCGYDRLEAVRVYHESQPLDSDRGPGSQYTETKFQAGDVAEDGDDGPEELEDTDA